ncbi:MAG: DUF2508 family protein [Ruminococcaceae bacterium]|jgi:hypothetical protein|nr:DUF2508 family protein [Oscillospiraceae bacterium]
MNRPIRTAPSPRTELQQELQEAARALRRAYDRFNYVCEAELVEASVYEINALQARYNYLLRAAKGQASSGAAEDGGASCR